MPCVSKALVDANMTLADVDAIAVSAGPGLAGCLAVGVSGAKALAWAANKPIYGINHVIGHIAVTQLQFGPFPKDTLASDRLRRPHLAAARGRHAAQNRCGGHHAG